MMDAFQGGMLALAKIRSGGQQVVVVQHVAVGAQRTRDGRRAGERALQETGAGGGGDRKVSGNPVNPMPIWQANLLQAQAAVRCGARTRAGTPCRSPAM